MAAAFVLADDATRELAVDILNELDWCLDQLEGMQTHRSVSDMTTTKVQPLHRPFVSPPTIGQLIFISYEYYCNRFTAPWILSWTSPGEPVPER